MYVVVEIAHMSQKWLVRDTRSVAKKWLLRDGNEAKRLRKSLVIPEPRVEHGTFSLGVKRAAIAPHGQHLPSVQGSARFGSMKSESSKMTFISASASG
jgi:hypothetical protein